MKLSQRFFYSMIASGLLLTTGSQAQTFPGQTAPPNTGNSSTPFVQQRPSTSSSNPFLGSTSEGKATAEVLPLTINDAIDRGLKYNLGLILNEQGTRAARGARMRALSDLMPKLTTRTGESIQQVNLAAYGFPRPAGSPSVVGPFSVFDTRAYLGQPILDLRSLNNTRAATEEVKASQFNLQDARETVVLLVANYYLQLLATQARVDAVKAQLETAEAVFNQAQNLKNNGVAAGIDVLRAQVQMQMRSQRLLSVQNDLEKQKLVLARIIGLPAGQHFEITDRMPDVPPAPMSLEKAITDAFVFRSDFKRAESLVKVAELNKKAAFSKALPSMRFDGDYGAIGRAPGISHGTFSVAVSLQVPIFQGGRVRAEVEEADAALEQRKAELNDFRGRIDAEVRSNYLDLVSTAKQHQVARETVGLANQQLTQARDRFAAGVAGSLEVTQAEEAVATANEDFINSLYAYNYAQALLARAIGNAELRIKQVLGEK